MPPHWAQCAAVQPPVGAEVAEVVVEEVVLLEVVLVEVVVVELLVVVVVGFEEEPPEHEIPSGMFSQEL